MLRAEHPNLRSYKLANACDAFGIKIDDAAHRALGDVQRALQLWIALGNNKQPSSDSIRVSRDAFDNASNYAILGHFNPQGECFYVWVAGEDDLEVPSNDSLWTLYTEDMLDGKYEIEVIKDDLTYTKAHALKERLLKKHAATAINRNNPARKPLVEEREQFDRLTAEIANLGAQGKQLEKTDSEGALGIYRQQLQCVEQQFELRIEEGLFGMVSCEMFKRTRCAQVLNPLNKITIILCKLKRVAEAESIFKSVLAKFPHARNSSKVEPIIQRINRAKSKLGVTAA